MFVFFFWLSLPGFLELRRFFTLCMAILLFMTLMLLSKLLIEDRSTKEGQRRGFISKFIPRCLPSLDLIFKRYVSELERFPVEPSHYVF